MVLSRAPDTHFRSEFSLSVHTLIMASVLTIVGRVSYFGLLITQCLLLVQFVVKYEGSRKFYWFLFLFLPTICAWFCLLLLRNKNSLRARCIWIVWLLYTWLGLVPVVGTIFGGVVIEGKLAKNGEFYGGNVLTTALCISPLLLLLLLNSSTEDEKTRNVTGILSLTVALDLFDAIEMLQVILDKSYNPYSVPKSLEIAILIFVCLFLILSPFELLQIKVGQDCDDGTAKSWMLFRMRTVLEVAFVNSAFLVIRLVLWFQYDRNASIFISKNAISIVICLLEISSEFRCCCQCILRVPDGQG